MTALAQNTTRYYHPAFARPTRRTPGKILRGAKLYTGALAFLHGDRLMPAQSLNNAKTPANGGPLQYSGTDANGGFRFIARRPNVTLTVVVSGVGGGAVWSVVYGATTAVTVTIGSATTAQTAYAAFLAYPEARQLLDGIYTGTGASTMVSSLAATAVPYVRIAGIIKDALDNSADLVNDLVITDRVIDVNCGVVSMANDVVDPATAADVGGLVSILDDLTITRTSAPLLLSMQMYDFAPAGAGSSLLPYILIP